MPTDRFLFSFCLQFQDVLRRVLERLIQRPIFDRQRLLHWFSVQPYRHDDFVVVLCHLALELRHLLQRVRNILEFERMPDNEAFVRGGLGRQGCKEQVSKVADVDLDHC
jgi:hypothetical protein